MKVQTINPANEEVIKEYGFQSAEDVTKAICESHKSFTQWRQQELSARLSSLTAFAKALKEGRQELAEMMTREMGKPLKDSFSEIDKCIKSCNVLATEFPRWHDELEHKQPIGYFITRQPL